MNQQLFGEVLVTLLVIMDPIGNVPIFLAVTRQLTPSERNHAALLACVTAFGIIAVFAMVGRQILNYLHVSVPALQGSGGLLLLMVALQLLTGSEQQQAEATPSQRKSVAMVPLGTPLLAGPGVIVAAIVFTENSDGRSDWMAIGLAILAVSAIVFVTLRFSGVVIKVVKPTGVLLLSRVAGILLAAIAVQMMADSVIAFARMV